MIEIPIGTLVTVLGVLVGTGGITAIVKIIVDRATGAEASRVAEVERMNAQREAERKRGDTERQRADTERSRADTAEAGKRIYAESLSLHRRLMFEAECFSPESVPPWPETP